MSNYTCSKCGKSVAYGSTHICVGPHSELEEIANIPNWWDGLEKDQLADDPRGSRGCSTSNRPSWLTCILFIAIPILALIINYLLW